MKLEDLRHREDEVRASLATLREKLDAAVATIERAERAREQAAAHGERTKSEGAYRDIAQEHAAELEAQMSGARLAAEQRERLRREEATLLEELERIRVGMEGLGVRSNVLPILDGIPLAAPCSVRWDEMSGNGDARTCRQCKLTVINVATTDAARAHELISACGRDLRLHRRADGTILARDCPTGAARRRFFSVAPFAILALMAAIAGVAFYAARVPPQVPKPPIPDIGQISVTDHPPSLEPGQFGGTPPVPRPPFVKTSSLRGASWLRVADGFTGLGGAVDTDVTLTRKGDTFDVKLTCSTFRARLSRSTTIPAAKVDAFLDAVATHEPTAEGDALCTHTDDYPRIHVLVGKPAIALTVTNCSYQWHASGLPLEDATVDASMFEPKHRDINEAYRAMLAAAGERKCFDDLEKEPPKPIRPESRREGCNPPYTVQANGTKVWKKQCL